MSFIWSLPAPERPATCDLLFMLPFTIIAKYAIGRETGQFSRGCAGMRRHCIILKVDSVSNRIWNMFDACAAALFLFMFCLPFTIRSESLAGFDAASASSVYSAGFSADLALKAGSGYWSR